MITPTASLLTVLSARHGAAHFSGPRADAILGIIRGFPEPQRVPVAPGTAALAGLPGPVVAGMLPSEDFLRVWDVGALPPEHRAQCEHERQNFISWFERRATHFHLQPSDAVLVPTATTPIEVTWADIAEWVGSVTLFNTGATLVRDGGRIVLALVGTDGSVNATLGPDSDGCACH